MGKLYDLAVGVGSYVNSQGEDKTQWLNVGVVMENEKGNKYILLNRTFNPAGVPKTDERSSVLISMFEPNDKSGNKTEKDEWQ